MRFIGVAGRKSSGKSDVVQLLHEYFINVETLSFSEPIKQMTKIAYMFTDYQLGEGKDVMDNHWGMTPRDAMRSTGNMMTFMDDSHMVDLMSHKIGSIDTSGLKILCLADLRFENEVDLVKKLGGFVIHVRNVNDDLSDEHISEVYSDDIIHDADYLLTNDGNMDNMRAQCENIFHQIHLRNNQ